MPSQPGADQFRQAFREEAREILLDLESALLELNEHPRRHGTGRPHLSCAAHHQGLGSHVRLRRAGRLYAHLENAFDEVRNGRLAVTSELVDLTLAALDQIGPCSKKRRKLTSRCARGNFSELASNYSAA